MLGAYLADAHLGRFKVIAIFSTIYFLGTLLLTLTRLLPGLVPEGNDVEATGAQTAVFWMAMYIIALGTGGALRIQDTFLKPLYWGWFREVSLGCGDIFWRRRV